MTHHAYIYEGPLALLPALASHARQWFGFTDEHNPDVHVREFEKFGIDEARFLSHTAALKSASGRELFVVGVSSMTTESQQALLKLFEEPPLGAVFVLLAPHGTLLPTLRSRTLQYPQELEEETSDIAVKKFLKSSYKDRSAQIAALLKDEEGQKERVRTFVNGLERELAASLRTSPQARTALGDIALMRGYLSDRSPSLKILLEHLALSLPQ